MAAAHGVTPSAQAARTKQMLAASSDGPLSSARELALLDQLEAASVRLAHQDQAMQVSAAAQVGVA